MLADADAVLALTPGFIEDMDIGVVGRHPAGGEAAWEVRAFFPKDGATVEDPVTGSLNASWRSGSSAPGYAQAPYVAAQGTVLGRRGRSAHLAGPGRHDLGGRRDRHLHLGPGRAPRLAARAVSARAAPTLRR